LKLFNTYEIEIQKKLYKIEAVLLEN